MTLPLSYSRLRAHFADCFGEAGPLPDSTLSAAHALNPLSFVRRDCVPLPTHAAASWTKLAGASQRAKSGGEGRTRTFEGARPTDLQSAAFDRFATSPMRCLDLALLRQLELMELAKGFEPPTG